MARRISLVRNPGARGDTDGRLARAIEVARDQGWEATVVTTDMRGHAFILAGEAASTGSDLVAAVGGDGTVREVAAGLAGTTVPLAIVPAGRGNSSYLELFGDTPWEEALAGVMAHPASRDVDLIELHPTGELGLLGFSAGWFAQIIQLAAEAGGSGPAAYADAAALAAGAPVRFRGSVRADGRLLAEGDLGLVAIGGARVRASVFPVFPASRLDDGLLEVLVVRATDSAGFHDLLGAVVGGRHLEHPLAAHAQARQVEISAPEGMLAEVDGDIWERDVYSVDVTCAPGRLRVARDGRLPTP